MELQQTLHEVLPKHFLMTIHQTIKNWFMIACCRMLRQALFPSILTTTMLQNLCWTVLPDICHEFCGLIVELKWVCCTVVLAFCLEVYRWWHV